MNNKQKQQDELQKKIRELQRELTEIDLRDKPLSDWNTEREEALQKEIEALRLELDRLNDKACHGEARN